MARSKVAGRHHRWSRKAAAWLTPLVCFASGSIAIAQTGLPMTGAEKLHRLDVMLKASAARCQASGSDLRADYIAFARNHRFALAQASHDVRLQLARRDRASAADQAYERLNFRLADDYRHQHPWLDCQELKVATHGLAMVEGSATLLEAADQILPDGGRRHLAAMRHE
jgi:hypothetical protein